jgi:hypothetical protein
MMEVIYLYWAFSTLFMFGSAAEDFFKGSKQDIAIYLIGILLAPLSMPFALGVAATKGGENE